jgi:hypothetical protein
MPCKACKGKRDIDDLSAQYVIRTCPKCTSWLHARGDRESLWWQLDACLPRNGVTDPGYKLAER